MDLFANTLTLTATPAVDDLVQVFYEFDAPKLLDAALLAFH